MPSVNRFSMLIFVWISVSGFLHFNSACGTQFKTVGNFFFPDTAIVDDDLVMAGQNLKLDGAIEGDLISASRSLVQNGLVEGSLNAVAQNIEVLGVVNGSARVFAQNISINGQVNRNLIACCAALNIRPDARIEKDVTAFSGELTLDGKIGGNLKGTVGTLIISGIVNQDVSIEADHITLMPTAQILGNFKYKSLKEAKIESGAQIAGETVWTKKEVKKEEKPKSIFTGKSIITETLFLFALMITGIVLTLLFKKNAYQAKQAVGHSFLKSLGLGFVFLVCIPIAILILIVTIIGIPIAVIAIFAYTFLVYIAKIPVATFLGDRIIKALGKEGESSLIWSMLLGLLILTLLFNIPYLEWLIYFVVLFTGFGAILLSQRRSAS